jgi:hypothetical protein
VKYFLRDKTLFLRPLSVAPALSTVIDALKDQPGYTAEILWLQGTLEETRKTGNQALKYADS